MVLGVMGREKVLLTVSPLLNDALAHINSVGENTSPSLPARHEAEPSRGAVPHGGQDDLVEQVVVELLGHFEAGPLHGHGGDQTQDDAQAAQHAEHRQIP